MGVFRQGVLVGAFMPRFSGTIWRFLRFRLGRIDGIIAQFIDGVPITTEWNWLNPQFYDMDPDPARALPTGHYFGDGWGAVRRGCESSESEHSSDTEEEDGMPRYRPPRAERRRRRARRALDET